MLDLPESLGLKEQEPVSKVQGEVREPIEVGESDPTQSHGAIVRDPVEVSRIALAKPPKVNLRTPFTSRDIRKEAIGGVG